MIVLKKPIVTEKSLREYKENRVVTFSVDLNATKIQIQKTVENVYAVKTLEVRVVNRLGKVKYSRFSKKKSKLQDQRIAYIKLDNNQKIDIFEQ